MFLRLSLWVRGWPVLLRYFGLSLSFYAASWGSSRVRDPLKDVLS